MTDPIDPKYLKHRKRHAGRPKSIIDWDRVGEMTETGAYARGIAATLGITEDTLSNRCRTDLGMDFSEFRRQKIAKGDESLRAAQFKNALSGNVAMQIWLGKQRLGQLDKAEVEVADKATARLAAQIELRAREKRISYEQELKYYLEHYAGDVNHKIKTQLTQQLVTETLQ